MIVQHHTMWLLWMMFLKVNIKECPERAAQCRHSFFFLLFFLSLCLGPLIRMVLDMISAGLDNGYTFLALPYAPHDTGSCPALLPHHSGNYPYSSRMVSLMTSRRTPSRMLKEVTRPPPSLAEQDMPIWDYLMYPVAVGLDQLSHFVYLP